MKIELKLSTDELVCINNQLLQSYGRRYDSVEIYNVIHSIIVQDLADRFDSKMKSIIKKVNLFEAKKKTKISLKYYEAWALKAYLTASIASVDNDYQRTLLQKQINNLDQQLK